MAGVLANSDYAMVYRRYSISISGLWEGIYRGGELVLAQEHTALPQKVGDAIRNHCAERPVRHIHQNPSVRVGCCLVVPAADSG